MTASSSHLNVHEMFAYFDKVYMNGTLSLIHFYNYASK